MALVPQVNRSFMDPASRYSQGALNARSAMRPNVSYDTPGKTAGGAISSGMAGGMGGAMLGSMVAEKGATGLAALGGPWFVGTGIALGLASYWL